MLQPPTKSIAASTAHEGGVFELSFRDERYLPFEGAGAVESNWSLELPSQIRAFDYGTISDVIIHISFEAKYDGGLKIAVEQGISEKLITLAGTNVLTRLFSLRHDFPDAYYRLLNPTGAVQSTEFEVTRQHFPYFLSGKTLNATSATISLKPRTAGNGQYQAIDTVGLSLLVNGGNPKPVDNWTTSKTTNLQEVTITFSGSPLQTWTIGVENPGLDKTTVDDILILLRYTVTNN
jgi:hypothetical protein